MLTKKQVLCSGVVNFELQRGPFDFRDKWWNMMEELDFQPGHLFAFTLLRKGLFHLTIFNESREAVTTSKTYSSYVLRNAFFYLGRKPAG
uniref:Uncharacterized protein n=1 Tax=Tanacetum cinerariifolium TaxID=118510 RepID=A0A699R005_TANCI|nr:hypothetical protein [Tanacetum cinerariifolium]